MRGIFDVKAGFRSSYGRAVAGKPLCGGRRQFGGAGRGRFHLTLDKLKPNNLLSLCWDGDLKKTGPMTFETTILNFAPPRDIHMLVLE